MSEMLEIAKFTIPAVVVFLTAYFLVKSMLDNEKLRRQHEIGFKNQKIATPLRLQAYERLVLFLERTSPSSLLPRVIQPKMTASEMQRELISTIRMEYEHNLTQQVYVSTRCWQAVVAAKDNMQKMVNMVAAKVLLQNKEASAQELAKNLLEFVMEIDQEPNSAALEIIKAEAKALF
jgi:hypothetical protein